MGDNNDREIWKRIEESLEDIASEQSANLPAIEIDLNLIARSLQQIANALLPPKATNLSLKYKLRGGTTMGAAISGTVGQVFDPSIVESNATVPTIQPIGPLAFASDNAAAVTVDAVTGIATMVAAGTANVSVIDQGNNLTDTVAFTVTATPPPVATALTLAYTLAVAQRRHLR